MLTEYLTMTNEQHAATQWQYVFIIAATLNVFGLYLFISSRGLQKWAITPDTLYRVQNIRKVTK